MAAGGVRPHAESTGPRRQNLIGHPHVTGLVRGARRIWAPAVLGLGVFVLLLPVARLDFDRHHDGYMLAQAIAVSDGLAIHRDVFGQYGPVVPWLQSLVVHLPVGPALALRLLNSAAIALTVFLLADLGRRRATMWPVGRAVGWWAAIAWLVLADVWIGIPMLPWSGTIVALLSVIVLYLVTRTLASLAAGRVQAAAVTAATAGAVLGTLPFVRINAGLAAVSVAVIVALLCLPGADSSTRRTVRWGGYGGGVSILVIIGALALNGSLASYFEQAIAWPLSWGSGATTSSSMTRLLLALIDQVPPAGALLTAMAVVYLRRTERAFTTLTRTQVSVVVIAAGALAALWQGRVWTLGIDTEWARWVQDWLVYWDVTDGDSRFMDTGYLYMFLVISLVMTGVLMGHVMGDRIRRRRWTPRTLSWLLLVGWALSGLVQVLPAWDARHVWWSLPAALVLLFAALGSVTRLSRVTRNPFWIPLGVAGLAACLGGIAYVGSPRVEAPASSLASGMWVTRQSAQSLASDLELLSSISVNYGARPLVFLTEDGDLSVAGGRYASADPFFVGWGPVPPLTARVAAEPMIVVTKGWGESKWGAAMQDMEGYRLVAENERARVYAPEG